MLIPDAGFVIGSNISFVLTYFKFIFFSFIFFWINLYLVSIWLHLPLAFSSSAIAIQALLSSYIFIKTYLLVISSNKSFNHIPCFPHSVRLTNSASDVDNVTFLWICDFQEIRLFPSKNIYPLIILVASSLT